MTKDKKQNQYLKIELANNLFQFFECDFVKVFKVFDGLEYENKASVVSDLKSLNKIISNSDNLDLGNELSNNSLGYQEIKKAIQEFELELIEFIKRINQLHSIEYDDISKNFERIIQNLRFFISIMSSFYNPKPAKKL